MPFSAQHILAILFGDMVIHSDRVSVRKRQSESERDWENERTSERKRARKRVGEKEGEKQRGRKEKWEIEWKKTRKSERERERKRNKRINQTNKIKIRSFYTFYGDCYSLSAHWSRHSSLGKKHNTIINIKFITEIKINEVNKYVHCIINIISY